MGHSHQRGGGREDQKVHSKQVPIIELGISALSNQLKQVSPSQTNCNLYHQARDDRTLKPIETVITKLGMSAFSNQLKQVSPSFTLQDSASRGSIMRFSTFVFRQATSSGPICKLITEDIFQIFREGTWGACELAREAYSRGSTDKISLIIIDFNVLS